MRIKGYVLVVAAIAVGIAVVINVFDTRLMDVCGNKSGRRCCGLNHQKTKRQKTPLISLHFSCISKLIFLVVKEHVVKMSDVSPEESARRAKVAQEKLWGYLIEKVERERMKPIALSIMQRAIFLSQSIDSFHKTVKMMAKDINPLIATSPAFTVEQTNIIIRTYNDIIEDLHSHFKRKDSYVDKFSLFNELEEPTINDVAKTLYSIGTNISQIVSYLTRWAF